MGPIAESGASLFERVWRDVCTYKARIVEECDRMNTLSPPPPAWVREDTTAIGRRLGSVLSAAALLVPYKIADRWATDWPDPRPA